MSLHDPALGFASACMGFVTSFMSLPILGCASACLPFAHAAMLLLIVCLV